MSETIEVRMTLPKLPPGKRYTGEFRPVQHGEQFFDPIQESVAFWPHASPSINMFLIVADVYQRPDWMKPGWLCVRRGEWWWAEEKPKLRNGVFDIDDIFKCVRINTILAVTRLEFTPPVYTGGPKNSLTEVV